MIYFSFELLILDHHTLLHHLQTSLWIWIEFDIEDIAVFRSADNAIAPSV